jgi:hypothetical protein
MKIWLADHLPQSFVGALDYHKHPESLDRWGGPFNGQCFRQMIFIDLVRACKFNTIVETGTFRGSTTLFLALNSGGAPVYTSEIRTRVFELARRRLRAIPNIHIYNSDSRKLLSTINPSSECPSFFYLDAHWLGDLPLAEETELIARKFPSFVIMIDDFQVPGDPGYGYDDYGPGKSLSLRDFPFDSDPRFVPYFPARRSTEESGVRRGCIVLASPDLRDNLDLLACLLPIGINRRDSTAEALDPSMTEGRASTPVLR